jgi:hypothetical protein
VRWTLVAAVITTLGIAGCSTVPRQDDVTRRSTYEIVDAIRCEAAKAVGDYGTYYRTAAVAYEFTFDAAEENDNSLTSSWVLPLVGGGTFGLGANAGINATRRSVRTFKIVDTFDELRAIKCPDRDRTGNSTFPIAGDIGIYEVVSTFIRLQKLDNPAAGQVFTFGDTLRFATVANANVGPKLTLVPVAGRFGLAEGSLGFRAARTDVHQVVLGLAGSRATRGVRDGGAPLGSSLNANLAGFTSSSPLLATTLIQAGADPKDRALLELDRQRLLNQAAAISP